ncbi:hypothetical protein QZH41_020490 [Actinostola sp. cb2023]|nr:hypothetical protein QZH41_020490 [Actinostola sp. cb2023]
MLEEKETYEKCEQEKELMVKYIRELERDDCNNVRGVPIPQLKTKQAQNKKLKVMKSRAQKVLSFTELFGLELDCLKMKDPKQPSKKYTINFDSGTQSEPAGTTTPPQTPSSSSPPSSSSCDSSTSSTPDSTHIDPNNYSTNYSTGTSDIYMPDTLPITPPENLSQSTTQASNQKDTKYSTLSEDDKARVESILYLIDKFGVGDEFIHQLSMIVEGMPRSYLFKQCKNSLNENCKLKTTPGKAPGAQHSFSELLAEQIKVLKKANVLQDDEKVTVKLSGDGARMSRVSNFILLSFAILQSTDDLLSSKGNHTIAVVNGPENRETLAECFREVFDEINRIGDCGYVIVDNKRVEIELFLGGDYKFLLLVMGLSAATSTYACVWCKVHKKDRGDMSKPDGFYDQAPMKRTLQEIMECVSKKRGENFCCVHQPLLHIPLDHIILDELHLMLRITDILIGNLVDDVMQWDDKDYYITRKRQSEHLKKLVEIINSCGVSFSVWEKRNADGKGSGTWDWTSLMGDDRKILLKLLPEKMETVLQQDTAKTVVHLWKEFADMYFGFISSLNPTNVDQYRPRIKNWIDTYADLGEHRIGYKRERVTCYMHSATYHVPQIVNTYKSLKQFSGQGVEKNSDDARRILQRKANHTDDPAEILRAEFRIQSLKHRERRSRTYTKRSQEYWTKSIKENRKIRKRLSYDKPVECILDNDATVNEPVPNQLPKQKQQRKRKTTSASKGNKKQKQAKKKSK